MSSPIITVENLSKSYRLQHQTRERYTALRDVLTDKVKGLFGKRKSEIGNGNTEEEFWALKDVSFEIKQGEVVGIIGRNGAGKSTLLKILSRITEPTSGRITLRGRVASLLEVGTGFHPELTGRENIFLNGAILGMNRQEVRRKFDEIVDFAEVEKFLDTPVKRYSSGMYVRLAFAVAAHLEPEILVVDEVLAVGDAKFQKKCLGRMKDVARDGRTVLFVSHDLVSIEALCTNAILLADGKLASHSSVKETIGIYLDRQPATLLCVTPSLNADRMAEVQHVCICEANGDAAAVVTTSSQIVVRLNIIIRSVVNGLRLALCLNDSRGRHIFSTNPMDAAVDHPHSIGVHTYKVKFPKALFCADRYSITVALYTVHGETIHMCSEIISFQVERQLTDLLKAENNRVGVIMCNCEWARSN